MTCCHRKSKCLSALGTANVDSVKLILFLKGTKEMKDKLLLDPERIRNFPDSFLEYFLLQDEVSEVTKVLIREVLKNRKSNV